MALSPSARRIWSECGVMCSAKKSIIGRKVFRKNMSKCSSAGWWNTMTATCGELLPPHPGRICLAGDPVVLGPMGRAFTTG